MQFLRDLRDLKVALADLIATDRRQEEEATFDLAKSAREFSRRTRAVVDDKLTFSATLMRAGEVDAASRLLAEVEADVHSEKVALFERVDQVRAARLERRERITRLRVVRMMAVAMLGSAVLGMSAIGMAFAGFLADREEDRAQQRLAQQSTPVEQRRADESRAVRDTKLKKLRIAGVEVELTPTELRVYQQLASGAVQGEGVEQLLSLLPEELAATIRKALGGAAATAGNVAEAVPNLVPRAVAKAKKKAAAKAAAEQQAQEEEEKPEPSPSPEPSPEPSPSDGDSEEGGKKKRGDSGGPLPELD